MKYTDSQRSGSVRNCLDVKELPDRERPREKLWDRGASSLSDKELIMVLLGSGNKKQPVPVLAAALLEILDGNQDPDMECLTRIKGMGQAKAAVICAALELGRRRIVHHGFQVKTPADVYPLLRHFADRTREHFICVSLNGAHEVIRTDVVSIGLVNRTLVHPREVFATPLQERAVAIIVAHNHPSGNLTPSPEDLEVTERLKEAGNVVGIEVLDHLIFSDETFYSLLEGGEF